MSNHRLPDNVQLIDHPLMRHLVAQLRESPDGWMFGQHLQSIAGLLLFETTRDLYGNKHDFYTGLGVAHGTVIDSNTVALVPIVRTGMGIIEPFRAALHRAPVWHVGERRDPVTHKPDRYLDKVPVNGAPHTQTAIVLDVMLATGGSACAVMELVVERCPDADIIFACVIAAPEGMHRLAAAFPRAHIIICQLDEGLTEQAYITPGLGDAGNRLYRVE